MAKAFLNHKWDFYSKPNIFLGTEDVLNLFKPLRLKTKEEMMKAGVWEDWIKEHPEQQQENFRNGLL